MVPLWLLLIFFVCTTLSLVLCSLAGVLFPRFRSGEYKPGPHRSDLPASGREIKTIELPLVGGPALILVLEVVGIGAGYVLHFSTDQWTLLLIGLAATAAFMLLGFIDDWNKVFSKEGLSQRAKFTGVLVISMAAAVFYFFLLPSGRQSYSPYIDFPIIGSLICPVAHGTDPSCPVIPHLGQIAYFAWLILLMLVTGIIGSVTSLSVDFSDGLDGLAGGLVFCAALAFGIIITGSLNKPEGLVQEVLSLLCAGSVLGFLPLNWPSSWAARRGTAKRRAKIYMGDSGALGLGGVLAMIAIFSRQEISLLLIGGAFVLEGLSALISAKIMARFFFRRHLQLLRFASMGQFVPHTEFPLPFLATPLHHHFDLLGWDRRRLVYGAWALGAGFALLGVMVGTAPQTWERYLGRILALILAWLIWSSGSWTRKYFVGKHPAERPRRRRLALYYGYPYEIMGIRLYHLVEIIEASENVIETPAEEAALWHRMNIFDARALLGLYCYRAGYYPAALAQWSRIPDSNLALRPEIARLLSEVDNRLALEKQETQPMRRDQILQQPPILTGNLSPADLPNPHTPVSSEETLERQGEWATSPQDSMYDEPEEVAEGDEESRQPTAPLPKQSRDMHAPGTNGNSNSMTSSNGVYAPSPLQPLGWLARLLRLVPTREGE